MPAGSNAATVLEAVGDRRSTPLNTNTTSQTEPVVEPIGHGCAPGASVAATIHDSATAPNARDAPRSARERSGGGQAAVPRRAIRARAGSGSSASKSLMLNARPSAIPAAHSRTGRSSSSARTDSQVASTRTSIISESIVSLRAATTLTGSTASAAAAISPADRPNGRRIVSYSSGTAAIPASAAGRRSAAEEKPRSFTLATCSQRSSGGLSIASVPSGSNAPRKNRCHDPLMLRTAES